MTLAGLRVEHVDVPAERVQLGAVASTSSASRCAAAPRSCAPARRRRRPRCRRPRSGSAAPGISPSRSLTGDWIHEQLLAVRADVHGERRLDPLVAATRNRRGTPARSYRGRCRRRSPSDSRSCRRCWPSGEGDDRQDAGPGLGHGAGLLDLAPAGSTMTSLSGLAAGQKVVLGEAGRGAAAPAPGPRARASLGSRTGHRRASLLLREHCLEHAPVALRRRRVRVPVGVGVQRVGTWAGHQQGSVQP